MDRYSKIKLASSSTKSRSSDFSDLQSFPLETKSKTEPQDLNFKTQEPKTQINTTLQKLNDSSSNEESNKTSNEGKFGMMMLSRNRSVSVSNSSSNRFKMEKQSTNAVKRAFSMRRSSSVSEKYCRIYDQTVTVASPLHGDDDEDIQQTSLNNKKKYSSTRILKACKRLLRI
ncbi:Cytosolic Fe-S cluster assembly factor nar-1 [Heracleum sosnowskyi]|uniref:Cytosolic Fe-S cluster assembly factor nar-1 n=1 Tax=Heracleum sosnowskyi TaxID=360622 RepID=A0AAD8NA64_9APIA|nr:Cytosolic Fe-S cluster assembly factor nar-1 [Heracleum sosnowskyi]